MLFGPPNQSAEADSDDGTHIANLLDTKSETINGKTLRWRRLCVFRRSIP